MKVQTQKQGSKYLCHCLCLCTCKSMKQEYLKWKCIWLIVILVEISLIDHHFLKGSVFGGKPKLTAQDNLTVSFLSLVWISCITNWQLKLCVVSLYSPRPTIRLLRVSGRYCLCKDVFRDWDNACAWSPMATGFCFRWAENLEHYFWFGAFYRYFWFWCKVWVKQYVNRKKLNHSFCKLVNSMKH